MRYFRSYRRRSIGKRPLNYKSYFSRRRRRVSRKTRFGNRGILR